MDALEPVQLFVSLAAMCLALVAAVYAATAHNRVKQLAHQLEALEGDQEEGGTHYAVDDQLAAYDHLRDLTQLFWQTRTDAQIEDIRETTADGVAVLDLPQFQAWLHQVAGLEAEDDGD